MIEIIQLFCLSIATIVGAGFSSGKEVLIFFNQYSGYIFINILSAFTIFFVTIFFSLKIANKYSLKTYKEFIVFVTNEKIGNILNKLIELFLVIIFFTMISGFGAFLAQVFDLPDIIGSLVLILATYITLKFDLNGIIKVSIYIVPAIIFGLILLLYKDYIDTSIFQSTYYIYKKYNCYFSGIIYAAYNMVVALPIIVSTGNILKKKGQVFITSILISFSITILILIIYFLINSHTPIIYNFEMPLLYIAKNISTYMYLYYILVICFSIYTTAISTIYCVVGKYSDNRGKYNFYTILICILSLLVSNIGFGILVEYGFSIIGCFGILQTILIINKFFRLTYKKS